MAATLPQMIRFQPQFGGACIPGGKVYFYNAGTTTPQAVYASDGTTPLTNPVILDSNGSADFRLGSGLSYKINVTNAADVQQSGWPIDNVPASDVYTILIRASLLADYASTTDIAKGDALIGVLQPFTGSVARTQHSKNMESVSILDFGAVGDGITNSTAAIQAAINYIHGTGAWGVVKIPKGTFLFTSIEMKSYVILKGEGGILKLMDHVCINASTTYYLLWNFDTDVVYDSVILDGNGSNNTLFLVADGITAAAARTVIKNCYIYNPPDSGIFFTSVIDGSCVNNIITGSTDLGIYVNATETTPCGDNVIAFNRIRNCKYGGIGIKRSSENNIVSNNVISQCGNGITVEDFGVGSGGAPDQLLIIDNMISEIGYVFKTDPLVAQAGIVLNSCTNVIVKSNRIKNCSGTTISIGGCSNCIIESNICSGYPSDPKTLESIGLLLYTRSTVVPNNLIICNNQFLNFTNYGGYFQSLVDSIVTNNIFQCGAGTGDGFRMNADVDNNVISYNVFNGAYLDTEIFSGATGNIMNYNRFYHATTEWEKVGHIKNDAVATPVSNLTPRFPGQLCWLTSGGNKIFMAFGLADTEWIQLA